MKLINLKIRGFKNLSGPDGWFEIDFENKNGLTVLVGDNGSGKSNVLEAISAIFGYFRNLKRKIGFEFKIKFILNGDEIFSEYKKESGLLSYTIDENKKRIEVIPQNSINIF